MRVDLREIRFAGGQADRGEPAMSREQSVQVFAQTAGRPRLRSGHGALGGERKPVRVASVPVAAPRPISATHPGTAIPGAAQDILSAMTARSTATAVLLYGYPHGFQQRH